ncbi:MAG: sugar nucleotide-binding protein [Rhodospirillales bacterium]
MTDVLVFGSTGLFGQALMSAAATRGLSVTGAARRDADITADIGEDTSISAVIDRVRPAMVINAAAMIDIGQCEKEPARAWAINARAPGVIAKKAAAAGARTIHISTDHYYSGDGQRRHAETDQVSFVNEYALTKFAGESLVLAQTGALVVRTNILGFRGWTRPTFAEWSLTTILEDRPAVLFEDSFISAIDVDRAAQSVLDLAGREAQGLINIGCRDVYSKKQFVEELAARLGRNLTQATTGSVSELPVQRAESLGLDVSRAEGLLGYPMPDLPEVLDAVLEAGAKRNAI